MDAVVEIKPSYVSVAAATHVGRVREKNEDAYVVADLTGGQLLDGRPSARFDVGERGVLLAVSDGMGGAEAGEVASALVVETVTRALADAPPGTPRDASITKAVQAAHRRVWDASQRDARRMGATLTACYLHAGAAFIAEVGDSRAYLIRKGLLVRLTKDQSLVQVLLDSGVLSLEQAEESPVRNVILQAMGHQPDVDVALSRLELRDRDCLVLCSDGLTTHVSDDEIREVVLAGGRPETIVHRLVGLANGRGGRDNVTVVVAGVGGELEGPRSSETFSETFSVLEPYEPELEGLSR